MKNIVIGTYTEDNVKQFSALLPISKKLKIISTFGLSKVHEIYFPKDDDKVIKWKRLSSDDVYTNAKIIHKQGIKTVPKVNPICESESQNIQSQEKIVKK